MNTFQFQFIFNKQTIRLIQIISAFQHRPSLELKQLSELTNSSIRTVGKDIHQIRHYFGSTIAIISSNKGYTFEIKEKKEFRELRRQLVRKEPMFEIIESIFYSETLTLKEWSQKLFFDEVTLKRYLEKVTPIFKKYNIKISNISKPIDFTGSEINIRKFFYDFYYNSDVTLQTIFPSVAVQEITHNIKSNRLFDEYSYTSFHSFNYILFIALERIKAGKKIGNPFGEKWKILMDKQNLGLELTELIQKKYDLLLSDEETMYLYTIFITDRSIYDSIESNRKFIKKFDIFHRETEELTRKYMSDTAFPLGKKMEIILLYQTFFTTVFLKNAISKILNYNLPEVINYAKTEFPLLYQKVYLFLKNNLKECFLLNDEHLLDSISSSLVFFTDSVVRQYWKSGKTIACIIEGPTTLIDSIRSKIFKLFEKDHNLYFPDALEISQKYWLSHNIDMILTNYQEISFDVGEDVEIYVTESIPTNLNWKELQKILNPKIPDFFPT